MLDRVNKSKIINIISSITKISEIDLAIRLRNKDINFCLHLLFCILEKGSSLETVAYVMSRLDLIRLYPQINGCIVSSGIKTLQKKYPLLKSILEGV
jgi:hypothetical protein